MSFDTEEENAAFAEEFDFPFLLLCDTEREVSERFGAVRPTGHPAADYARRVSYLIDPSGTVRRAYEVEDIASHPSELLDDLRSLAS